MSQNDSTNPDTELLKKIHTEGLMADTSTTSDQKIESLKSALRAGNEPIKLRQLAVIDLAVSYARNMGDGKMRHYRVSAVSHLAGFGLDPFDAVKEHIKNAEGDTREVVLVNRPEYGKIATRSAMQIEDASELLKSEPRVLRELKQRSIKSHLYQYNRPFTLKDRSDMRDSYVDYQGVSFRQPKPSFLITALVTLLSKIGLSFLASRSYTIRLINPVTYLSYTFRGEEGKKLAYQAMRKDLKALSDRGLIQGNLSMPSTLTLADTDGFDDLKQALFCFVIVDRNLLAEQMGINLLELPSLPLKQLGVNSETYEGGIGPHIGEEPKYEIEHVQVEPENTSDALRQEMINNYMENVKYVNEVAKKQNVAMETLNKFESNTQTIFTDRGSVVQVDVKFEENSPEAIALNQQFKKND